MCNCVSLAPFRRLVLLPAVVALLMGRLIEDPRLLVGALGAAVISAIVGVLRRLDRNALTLATLFALIVVGAVTRPEEGRAAFKEDPPRPPLSLRADETLSPRAARFARIAILGERDAIEAEERRSWRRAGLSHILAVSGLHVGIIAGLAWGLARLSLGAGRISEYAAAAAVFSYVLGIGAPFSALRAGLMAVMIFLGRAMGRPGASLNLLFGAGFITLLLDPKAASDPGFQLSYAATFGLILWTRPISGLLPARPRHAMTLLAATVAAQALTIPLMLWHFREIAPIAFLGNLAVLPLFTLIMPLLILGIAGLAPAAWLADRLLGTINAVIEALGGLPGAAFLAERPPSSLVVLLIGLGLLPLFSRGRVLLRIAALMTVAALLVLAADRSRPQDGVYLVADRRGGAGLLVIEDDRVVLLDDGVTLGGWKDVLTRFRIAAIDTIVATAPAAARFSGAGGLVEFMPIRDWSLPIRRQGDDDDRWRVRRLERYGVNIALRNERDARTDWREKMIILGRGDGLHDLLEVLRIERIGPRAIAIHRDDVSYLLELQQ
jgi:ComEC/Rec2-related protein